LSELTKGGEKMNFDMSIITPEEFFQIMLTVVEQTIEDLKGGDK